MEEWCTIENNSEVFTQLIKNIGVKGVQFEEILSLDSLENSNNQIYGLIFISQYIKNIISTPNILSNWDKDLFFSKQLIENANAIQAILGILLNNEDKIDIGSNLKKLKIDMAEMDPVTRGITLSNNEILKKENNKFKVPNNEGDIYHFVTFIHFRNEIYELDGLREGPILFDKNVEFKDWIKKIKSSLNEKIYLYGNNELKFNILALVPDKLEQLKNKKELLMSQKNYIDEKIKGNIDIKNEKYLEELKEMNKDQLEEKLKKIDIEINECNNGINIEKMKINKYKEENERRQHNYNPLIFELLKIMGENNILQEVYQETYNEEK